MLRLRTIAVFSLAILPIGMLNVAIPVYLPPFFAGDHGLGLAAVGAAFATVRLMSIGIDPALGILMDRTRTRFGRYRIWMLAGVPVLMLSTYLLFTVQTEFTTPRLIALLLLLYAGNSMVLVGQSAWSATLATQYNERSRLFGVMIAMSVIGAVLVLVLPFVTPGLTNAQAVPAMGWLVMISAPLAVGAATWFTPERLTVDASPRRIAEYGIILRKPDVVRLLLAQFALTLGPGWTSSMYVFYCVDALGYTASQTATGLLIYVLAGALGSPTASRVAVRSGKHRAIIVFTAIYSLALCGLFLLKRGDVTGGYVLMAACGFTAFGFDVLVNAIMADVGDEIRLQTGTERIGLLYALKSMATKLAYALSIGVTFPLLEWVGYDPARAADNSSVAIHSMQFIYVGVPIVAVLAGGCLFIGWRLDAARHALVRKELECRDKELMAADTTLSKG